MITVKNIYNHLNKLANINLAEKWDNVGLMIGNYNDKVTSVLVCLDITTKVVREAIDNNISLIISHHPLIFKPLKSLNFTDDFKSNIIRDLIQNNISVISFHTNLDSATLGLNDFLAKKLELKNIQVLFEHEVDKNAGLGRIGNLPKVMKQDEFISYVKEKFELETVSAILGNNKDIETVALLGGSGADFIYSIPPVDIYLTGDIGYHIALDTIEMKKNMIDIGHFTENLVKELLYNYISELKVNVMISNMEQSPFKIL